MYTLTHAESTVDATLGHMGSRLAVTCMADSGDSAIFLYRKEASGADTFLGVCSPLDMTTWAATTPATGQSLYRLAAGDWLFYDAHARAQFWEQLQTDVGALRDAKNLLSNFASLNSNVYPFGDASKSLTLARAAVTTYALPDGTSSYRLHVTCTSSTLDPKIFMHSDDLFTTTSRPVAVARPVDLAQYPPDAPRAGQYPRYYRTADFDIATKDLALLNDTWSNIARDTAELVAALEQQANLLPAVDTEI